MAATSFSGWFRDLGDKFGSFLLYRLAGRVIVLGLPEDRGGNFKEYCFNENMPERVAALKKNLDEESLAVIDYCIEQMKYAPGQSTPEKMKDVVVLANPKTYRTPWDNEYEKEFLRRYKELKRRYRLPIEVHIADVCMAHHGLIHLPQRVLDHIKGKDVVDGGAFIGDSALVFREYGPRKIYSFDISDENQELFEKTMRLNEVPANEVEFVPAGLGEKNEVHEFCYTGGAISTLYSGDESRVGDSVASSTQVVSVDEFAAERNLHTGLIKLDIEGFESGAVRGAVDTIRRDRPILDIAIYHNPTDFFEIKPYLESLDLNYRWIIRRLCSSSITHIPSRHLGWWLCHITPFVETYLIGWPAELETDSSNKDFTQK